ncbi:NAD(P)H-quinone oxidoreductase subunit 5 [Striga asiatica]|uniref:NAD(P)H-quinone oxidoreductase subunit 5 n=1 Tax=Striga asiatica TaxID=4170 RepID=A0A5A7PHH5_STRAF|nr:NAD(P)H-quinone oxidoreductase subunit 5 [Striga asiatica]
MKPRKKPSSTRTRPTASGSRLRSDKEMGFVSYINLAEDEPAAAQCENRAVNATNAAAGIACEENSLLKDYVTEKGECLHFLARENKQLLLYPEFLFFFLLMVGSLSNIGFEILAQIGKHGASIAIMCHRKAVIDCCFSPQIPPHPKSGNQVDECKLKVVYVACPGSVERGFTSKGLCIGQWKHEVNL